MTTSFSDVFCETPDGLKLHAKTLGGGKTSTLPVLCLPGLTRTADGGVELDGDGEIVEYLLEMRRFDQNGVLATQPWAIDDALEDSLGRTVARFHGGATLRPQGGGVSALGYTIRSNANLLRGLAPRLGKQAVERLVHETDIALERLGPLLDARAADGFARHCHGDLHLGNILIENGQPILFDCIEFNDTLSDIDIQYDLAFLLMDLDFRRRRDAAGRVLNAYLDEAARSFGEGLWTGLAALPLMLSVRAAVRTHVWAYTGDDEAARRNARWIALWTTLITFAVSVILVLQARQRRQGSDAGKGMV